MKKKKKVLSLNRAIEHADENVVKARKNKRYKDMFEHKQLADWFNELKKLRKEQGKL